MCALKMSNIEKSSCSNCTDLQALLDNKVLKIRILENHIRNLKEALESYKINACQICHCSKNVTNEENILDSKKDLFSEENVADTDEDSEQQDVDKNFSSDNQQKTSEDYIYDENYKMYYCVSTGYYYDKTSGLYYIPENRAYYTYDYNENCYVLYKNEDNSKKSNLECSQSSNDTQDNENSKADESCESVVIQVNNMSLNEESDNVEEEQSKGEHNDCEENVLNGELDETDNSVTTDWQTPAGTNLTIEDLVREVAEQQTDMSDYVFDEQSQMYYSSSTGYYYDAVRNLLYDPQTGIYYKYDEDKKSYDFHHQIDLSAVRNSNAKKIMNSKLKARRRYWRKKLDNSPEENPKTLSKDAEKEEEEESYSSPEEGELFSSDSEEEDVKNQNTESSSFSSIHSPCIRAIVKDSENLKIGTFILIACTGGIIGSAESNLVYIPDEGINKMHAEIKFDEKTWKYSIKDLGSENGTFVNDKRLSQAKEESEFHILKHGDIVSVDLCKFLFHIHNGYETCDDCEPGKLLAESTTKEEKYIVKTKEEKYQEMRKEVKRLKMRFGIQGINFRECLKSNYEDRAKERRRTVGSENPYAKTEVSSVDRSMNELNVGYKMLKKLGWKDGESLGATGTGISEPIPVRGWFSKAGLGSTEMVQESMQTLPENKRNRKWIKAKERFLKLN